MDVSNHRASVDHPLSSELGLQASFAGHAYHLDVASMTIFIVWMIAGCGPAYHNATDNSPYNSQERDGHTPSPKCGKLKVPVQVSVGGSAAPSWEYNTKEQDVRYVDREGRWNTQM